MENTYYIFHIHISHIADCRWDYDLRGAYSLCERGVKPIG